MSLLAVLAVSAVASATANATHVYKIEGSELTSTEAVEGDSLSGKLETIVAKLPISIQCEEDLASGEIESKGKSKGKIEFKNCIVVEVKNGKKVVLGSCEVKEPVIAEFTDELTEHSVDIFTGSKANSGFVELEIKTCALKGKYPVKGSQACATPESELEKVVHVSICTPAGSKLSQEKEGTEVAPAQLFGEEQLKLKSAKNWGAN